MLLTHIRFATPLVVAWTALLVAFEQQARAHAVSNRLRSWC
jgi:hypothetical protein